MKLLFEWTRSGEEPTATQVASAMHTCTRLGARALPPTTSHRRLEVEFGPKSDYDNLRGGRITAEWKPPRRSAPTGVANAIVCHILLQRLPYKSRTLAFLLAFLMGALALMPWPMVGAWLAALLDGPPRILNRLQVVAGSILGSTKVWFSVPLILLAAYAGWLVSYAIWLFRYYKWPGFWQSSQGIAVEYLREELGDDAEPKSLQDADGIEESEGPKEEAESLEEADSIGLESPSSRTHRVIRSLASRGALGALLLLLLIPLSFIPLVFLFRLNHAGFNGRHFAMYVQMLQTVGQCHFPVSSLPEIPNGPGSPLPRRSPRHAQDYLTIAWVASGGLRRMKMRLLNQPAPPDDLYEYEEELYRAALSHLAKINRIDAELALRWAFDPLMQTPDKERAREAFLVSRRDHPAMQLLNQVLDIEGVMANRRRGSEWASFGTSTSLSHLVGPYLQYHINCMNYHLLQDSRFTRRLGDNTPCFPELVRQEDGAVFAPVFRTDNMKWLQLTPELTFDGETKPRAVPVESITLKRYYSEKENNYLDPGTTGWFQGACRLSSPLEALMRPNR